MRRTAIAAGFFVLAAAPFALVPSAPADPKDPKKDGGAAPAPTAAPTCTNATCASGKTYQTCNAGGSQCYYQGSDGTKFACASCSDCAAAQTSIAGWCSQPAGTVIGSCAMKASSSCLEYFTTGGGGTGTNAYQSTCAGFKGTWSGGRCDRTGAVGGCRGDVGAHFHITWTYAPAAAPTCASGEKPVSP